MSRLGKHEDTVRRLIEVLVVNGRFADLALVEEAVADLLSEVWLDGSASAYRAMGSGGAQSRCPYLPAAPTIGTAARALREAQAEAVDRRTARAGRCPRCGHAVHGPKVCLNMASDNDCDCRFDGESLRVVGL